MKKINSVEIETLRRDLGRKGLQEIMQLQKWLRHPHKCPSVSTPSDKELQRLDPRFASSIITRGEAELLSISLPRFSFRIYFEGNAGFVNCRRLGTMCSNVMPLKNRKSNQTIWDNDLTEVAAWRGLPTDTIQKGTVIADSLLSFPRNAPYSGFKVLTAQLGKAYGESANIEGTPFIKNFDLTGLCAQATCFMANALLANHARGIHGIGEISKLAYFPNSDDAAEMEIFGLGKKHFINYFRHSRVGLNAFWHTVHKHQGTPLGPGRSPAERFYDLASVYLKSGFPIVVLLDAGRMAGIPPTAGRQVSGEEISYEHSIYKSNGLAQELMREHFELKRIRSHAALMVGYNNQERTFLLNDPARFPFMKASAEQIWNARAYNDEFNGTRNSPVPNERDFRFRLLPLQFMPCLPGPVNLPLIDDEFSPEDISHPAGRWTLEKVIRNVLLALNPFGPETATDFLRYDIRRLVLMPLTKVCDWIRSSENPLRIDSTDSRTLAGMVNSYLESHGSRWCWINWFERGGAGQSPSLWIYDAEQSPNETEFTFEDSKPEERALQFLVARFVYDRGAKVRWSHTIPQGQLKAQQGKAVASAGLVQKEENSKSQPVSLGQVKLSLLTSFSVKGVDEAVENWPDSDGGIGAELYCFMQEDARKYLPSGLWRNIAIFPRASVEKFRGKVRNWFRERNLPRFNRKTGSFLPHLEKKALLGIPLKSSFEPSAVERMAKLAEKTKAIDSLAKSLIGRFGKKSITILALASYFPELSSSDHVRRRKGVAALKFLVRLGAAVVRHQDYKDNRWSDVSPRMAIEFVGGTVMDGIFLAERINRPEYDKRRLVANIRDWGAALDCLINSLIEVAPAAKELDVTLLAEMEPGPGYVLGSCERVRAFSTMIRAHPGLQEVVGVNLDWAHWHFIEGHSISTIPLGIKSLMNRGHVSDHCNGAHFGDVAINAIHRGWQNYRDFFEFFAREQNKPRSVSVELECAGDISHVQNSFRFLKQFGIGNHEI